LCVEHGARGVCTEAGCNTHAASKGLCKKHGVKKACNVDGCSTTSRGAKGTCSKHAAELAEKATDEKESTGEKATDKA
jgi:hypothetical protein